MGGKAGRGKRFRREEEQKRACTQADWLRPMLQQERGWEWAIGLRKTETREDIALQRKAVVRITKKAVGLMYPEQECSVRRDRSRRGDWVHIRLVIGQDGPAKGLSKKSESAPEIRQKIEDTLTALGIAYAKRVESAESKDDGKPCLSILVRRAS